jgi:polyphenol oxidase
MKNKPLSSNIKYKIFDKTFELSTGIYGLSRFQDEENLDRVRNNHNLVLKTLKADNLLILKHVHGNTVVDADVISDFLQEPEADGAVTSKQSVIISIQSADCVPILLASNDGNVIGGVHCGWRSTVANVIANAVTLMQNKGATKINAIIGPAIHQKSYEVDQSFYDVILGTDQDAAKLFTQAPKAKHYLFDLLAFVIKKLNDVGIENILNLCEDTYSNSERYYSYRRDVHLGCAYAQTNILSTIVIKK